MIYICGDTHGEVDFDKLEILIKRKLSYKDILIILGDCGICWSKETFSYNLKLYNKLNCTVIYIDGNHENFDMLNGMPIVNLFGANVHKIDEHIFHVLRGEILNIDNISFLCMGGACSTDTMYRKENVSWWKQEEITDLDLSNAFKNLERYNNSIDYVLTHTIDSSVASVVLGKEKDICTEQLAKLQDIISYKYWLFGHYHIDKYVSLNKICLYNKVFEIYKDDFKVVND
mgnify:CR=1 FL=1